MRPSCFSSTSFHFDFLHDLPPPVNSSCKDYLIMNKDCTSRVTFKPLPGGWGWGDGSVGKELTVRAWGLEFRFRAEMKASYEVPVL